MKRTTKIVFGTLVLGAFSLIFPLPVFAAAPRLEFDALVDMLANGLTILMGIGGAAAVAMLLWGGISYIMSAGDKQAVDTAKKTITYALVGLALIIGAILIVQTVADWVGRPIS